MARSEDEAEAFALITLIAQRLEVGADRVLRDLGVTGRQWLLLAILTRTPAGDPPPTITEAAQVYGTSHQNLKQVARQLERRGFLVLERDPNDRRVTRLRLTDAVGRFDEPAAVAAQRAFLTDAFAALDDARLGMLRAALSEIAEKVAR